MGSSFPKSQGDEDAGTQQVIGKHREEGGTLQNALTNYDV